MRVESVYDVFVASPNDVKAERDKLAEVIDELNRTWSKDNGISLRLIRWETDAWPSFGGDAQHLINEQIGDEYDIFIGIMWHRVGTITPRAGSGTIEEFERAKARHDASAGSVKIMFYFKTSPPPSLSDIDPGQLTKVNEFQKTLGQEGGLYWTFQNLSDFESSVRSHLSHTLHLLHREGPKHTSENKLVPVMTDPEEELGMLDYMDLFERSMAELGEVCLRIGEATTEMTNGIVDKTQEMLRISKQSPISSTDKSNARQIIRGVSLDIDFLSDRLDVELPLFRRATELGLDSFSRAIAIQSTMPQDARACFITGLGAFSLAC